MPFRSRVDNIKTGHPNIYHFQCIKSASLGVEKNKMNVGLWNTVFQLGPWRAWYLSLLSLPGVGVLLLMVVVL